MAKREEKEFKELIEFLSDNVLEILQKESGITEEEAEALWFNCRTYERLQNEETNVWQNSPAQLKALLIKEIQSRYNILSDRDPTIQICAAFFKEGILIFALDNNGKYRAEVTLLDSEIESRVYFQINLVEIATEHIMQFNKKMINRCAVDTPDKLLSFAEDEIEYAIRNGMLQNALKYLDKVEKPKESER